MEQTETCADRMNSCTLLGDTCQRATCVADEPGCIRRREREAVNLPCAEGTFSGDESPSVYRCAEYLAPPVSEIEVAILLVKRATAGYV